MNWMALLENSVMLRKMTIYGQLKIMVGYIVNWKKVTWATDGTIQR